MAKRKAPTVTTRAELVAYMARQGPGANPLVQLIQLMRTSPDEHIRLACATSLADRLIPKLKAVAISGDPAAPLTVAVEQLELLSDAELRALAYGASAPPRLPHEN